MGADTMKLTWEKIGTTINREGTTITYGTKEHGRTILVQSRKRHIPHANGSGTWDHTTYFVIFKGKEVKELWRLGEAKKWAEENLLPF